MRTGTPIQVYLPPGMKPLLEELCRRNVRKMSAEVVLAIRERLAAHGLRYDQPDEKAEPPKRKGRKK